MVNKLELHVMWSVAPESMTHLEEEDIRHVSSLPNLESVVVGVEAWHTHMLKAQLTTLRYCLQTQCEQIEIFDFDLAASYTPYVYVMAYNNNNIPLSLRANPKAQYPIHGS